MVHHKTAYADNLPILQTASKYKQKRLPITHPISSSIFQLSSRKLIQLCNHGGSRSWWLWLGCVTADVRLVLRRLIVIVCPVLRGSFCREMSVWMSVEVAITLLLIRADVCNLVLLVILLMMWRKCVEIVNRDVMSARVINYVRLGNICRLMRKVCGRTRWNSGFFWL